MQDDDLAARSLVEPSDGEELDGEDIEFLFAAARTLLEDNTESHVLDGETHQFTVPSKGKYPFQWFWDSCFHAIVWTHFDLDRAKKEIRALLTAQREDGFIPHIVYWDQSKLNLAPLSIHWTETRGRFSFVPFAAKPRTSELMQPPVIAEAVQKICDKEPADLSFLQEVLPPLNAHYAWLRDHRDPDGDHLITIVAPYESGIDACPAYDEVIGYRPGRSLPFAVKRYGVLLQNALFYDYDEEQILRRGAFHVEDVLVNALYALNLRILADLNERAGNLQMAKDFAQEATAVERALIEKCWDPDRTAFFNLNGRHEERSKVLTIQSLMPLVLADLPKPMASALVEHLMDSEEFALAWPVPSVPRTEASFSADSRIHGEGYPGLWRGPSWVNTNRYLCCGMRSHGFGHLADAIEARTCLAVHRHGFPEYINPLTGAAGGSKPFGWSTLVVDLEYFTKFRALGPVDRSGSDDSP